MSVARAIRLPTPARTAPREAKILARMADRFAWVYLGEEFCENRFPTDDELLRPAELFYRRGKNICFLTPALSERGLARLAGFVDAIQGRLLRKGCSSDRFEISVNDFGAVHMLSRRGLGIKVNAGRLFQDNVFAGRKGRWPMLLVQNEHILKLFDSCGIHRFEVSATDSMFRAAGVRSGFAPRSIGISMFYPYLNLASTRACPIGAKSIPPERTLDRLECGRECEICAFELDYPGLREKLILQGNTVFMRFPGKLRASENELLRMRVDRLVYCPFP